MQKKKKKKALKNFAGKEDTGFQHFLLFSHTYVYYYHF